MKRIIYVLLASLVILGACNSSADEGRIIVRLTDSPGDYEAVNIDIVGVQVHRSMSNAESGWIDLDVNAGVYNLLDLTDGVETVIADSRIPAGQISQLRLVLGDNNTVVVDGVEYDIITPSAAKSGLKLIVDESLLEGITYSLLLDFDAAKSIVKTGSMKYILKPVIKTVTEARDGAIEGTVLPSDLSVAIYAMVEDDTLGTTFSIENSSSFFLGGLEGGTYDVVFDPGETSGYLPSTITGVEVNLGEITNVGETALSTNN